MFSAKHSMKLEGPTLRCRRIMISPRGVAPEPFVCAAPSQPSPGTPWEALGSSGEALGSPREPWGALGRP